MAEPAAPAPELFVQLGILDPAKLQTCLETQKNFEGTGVALSLAQVILNLGYAQADQVARVVAHGTTARLRCKTCGRRYTVPEFQAQRRYKCEPCREYLEVVPEEVLGEAPKPSAPGPAAVATLPAASPAPRKDPFEGRTLGKYLLLRRLAKGGMGAVYLGEHAETRKQVAVKVLTEEFSKMPGIQGRFKREAETSSRLEHPNIVQTFEMSQDGPYTYIVSEYVDGGSLIDLIVREKQLTPKRACELALDILSALDHAHGRGVVHRDIKPGNVLVTTQGSAKVIDFGLAKDAEANTILTLSGNVVGTPAFMAPEQAMGEPAGALADLYSTGILLYLMLTGKKPFEGKSIVDTLHKQINEPLPSPRALNPDVPEELELVLKRICAKQASKRPAGLQEAMAAIRKAVGMETPAAAPAPAPAAAPADADEWGWLWAAGGLLALAAAVVYRVFSR